MELQLESIRVDFLVKVHSTHNVKWVLTAIGYTHFWEEFAWSGWIVSSTVFQSFCSCSSAPVFVKFFAEGLQNPWIYGFCYFTLRLSVFWTHTILLTVHTVHHSKNWEAVIDGWDNRHKVNYKALKKRIPLSRLHNSRFIILLIENLSYWLADGIHEFWRVPKTSMVIFYTCKMSSDFAVPLEVDIQYMYYLVAFAQCI